MKFLFLTPLLLLSISCATLHHVQLGDINSPLGYLKIPIEVKVSEVGVDLKQLNELTQPQYSNRNNREANVLDYIQMFQMGPTTGAPVYNDTYAENVMVDLLKQCPTGLITGINAVRETREYPVIKGEIVKITAYCLRRRS